MIILGIIWSWLVITAAEKIIESDILFRIFDSIADFFKDIVGGTKEIIKIITNH